MTQHLSRVVLVDDDPTTRELTRLLLTSMNLDLIAYENPNVFLSELPDVGCVVLDVRMPEMSGLEVFRRMREAGMQAQVIFLTGHGDVSMAVEVMRAGAFHFLEKPANEQKLLDTVFAALDADAKRRDAAGNQARHAQMVAKLTKRERQIADLLGEGLSSREIAEKLDLSVRTVEGYRSQIYAKLETHSLAQVINTMRGALDVLPGTPRV